ncbi:hypothetical protein HIM_00524 [Hirsutella minnesotensis 3608]|nr:hypothetical protein HIM_00524 [Hirsutella minnesotensis 3608]
MGSSNRPSLWQLLLLTLSFTLQAVSQRPAVQTTDESFTDPFYEPPADLDAYPPGSIIRQRVTPQPIAAFMSVPINIERSHQLLYRTNDNFNRSLATVLTVLVPRNADFSKVLSYQMATDAADHRCIPSVAVQKSDDKTEVLGTALTGLELVLVATILARGWVVILPDHGGPDSAFLANRLAGQATLDGIRAALASTTVTRISRNARVVMWGYSGGSLATGWAAEIQPSYAPELMIAGAAMGGVMPDISTVLQNGDRGLFAGLLPSGIFGLAKVYPQVEQIIEQHLLPSRRAHFLSATHNCLFDNALRYLFQDIQGYFDNRTIFTSEPVTSILDANGMGHAAPRLPLYVYKGALDELSSVNETDALVRGYCAAGTSVEYLRILDVEHIVATILGVPGAINWLVNVMNGEIPRAGCSTRSRIIKITDPEVVQAVPLSVTTRFLGLFFGGMRSR